MEDILVFSHLRWNFVFQRPQQIISRLAKNYRIIFIEEEFISDESDGYTSSEVDNNVWIVQPNLQKTEDAVKAGNAIARKRALIDSIVNDFRVTDFISWYYSPMFFAFTRHLYPHTIIYDCMDELSAFLFAPSELINNEAELLEAADIVFTGGISLYEAKKELHSTVYCMPSSIDKAHFSRARNKFTEPADQAGIGYPRFGFFGVVDERFDIVLMREVAERKPGWQFVIIGPIVKIDEKDLPQLPNIHYLGIKSYKELPSYISNWQVAFLPFAMNPSTRFISPTKTPEYLAAGKPAISTPVKDVVRTYGNNNLVAIAENAAEFIAAGEELLLNREEEWLAKVDLFLANMSWDNVVMEMNQYLLSVVAAKKERA